MSDGTRNAVQHLSFFNAPLDSTKTMNHISKNLLASTLLAGAMALGAGAHATPTVEIGFDRNDLFPAGSHSLTLKFDDDFNSLTTSVLAGMFGGAATNGKGFDTTTLYRSADDVLFYCVDILNNLKIPATEYLVNDITPSLVVGGGTSGSPRRDFGRVLDFLGAVNSVLAAGTYNLGFDDKNWLNPNAGWMSGAIQVGIWESLYETAADLAVDTGKFQISAGLSTEGGTLLGSVFTAMKNTNTAALDSNQVKWFSTDQGQDLIGDPEPVPVPAPLVLLGAGLGLLAFARRFRGRR